MKARRRVLIGVGLLALCLMIAGITLAFRQLRPSPPPNVLLITIDTLRADHVDAYRATAGRPGAAGGPSITPTLDALAARGTLFVNAVCQVPLTLPSHASMLTGFTPPAHGIRDNPGFALGPRLPTVAEQFRKAGYATAAHVSGYPLHHRFGLDRGFDVYDDRFPRGDDPARPFVERRADATVKIAAAWVQQAGGRGTPARPFFLWVHLFDPHAPYDPPEPFRSRFRDRPYDGEIAFADSQVAALLDVLSQRGLLSNTIVMALSDHGEGLGEHGEATHGLLIYDSTIRIPLVLAGPGVRAGSRIATLVRALDVGPTLLDLAGLPPFPAADGRSLRAAARGERLPPEDAYVESLFARLSFGWAPLYGWRTQKTMFIDAPRPEIYDVESDGAQLRDLSSQRPADVGRYQRLVRAAASRPGGDQSGESLDAASRQRLASLGYVSGGQRAASRSLRNPKDFTALAFRVEHATTIEQSDPRAAINELRAALQEDPDNALARQHLAIALSKLKRIDEALRELQPLLADSAANADVLALAGECYRVAGRHDEALNAFRQAAEHDPRSPDPLVGRGRTLVALGRFDEARETFERAVALAPESTEALVALADLALQRGDLADARARLEIVHRAGNGEASADLKLGVVLVRQGELNAAIALFRDVADSQPGNTEAAVDLGGALAKAGRAAEAVPYFELAVAAGARSTTVLNSLGFARLESGNTVKAAEAFRQSLALRADQPRIVEILRELGR